jgi:hypothetical protein
LYSRSYQCLYDYATFEVSLLYATARDLFQRSHELLDFTIFARPTDPNAPFVDYLLLEVKVCPTCAFASNDPGHFESGNPYVQTFQPDELGRQRVLDQAPARLALLQNAPTLEIRERTLEDALTSYKLGIQSSSSLFSADPHQGALEIVRSANYALKAAHLCEGAQRVKERDMWNQVALGYLLRTLEVDLKGAALAKSLYQLGALSYMLGDKKPLARAFSELRKMTEESPTRESNMYYQRLRRIWLDREEVAPPA